MFCPTCGKPNSNTAQQCAYCGAQLSGGGQGLVGPGYPAPVKTNGLAIASLVTAILSLFCGFILSIPSLIMGIVALNKIDRSQGAEQGKGLAIGAIATSMVVSAMWLLILPALLFPVFARARETARKSTCQDNLRQCGVAIQAYCEDYDGVLPSSAIGPGNTPAVFVTGSGAGVPSSSNKISWGQIVYDYIKYKDVLFCPSDSSEPSNYTSLSYWWKTAANDAWLGQNGGTPRRKMADFAYGADQILLYEHAGFHSGEPSLRDGVQINVCFMDGHIRNVVLRDTANSNANVYPSPGDTVAPDAAGEPMYYNYNVSTGTALPVARNTDAGNCCDRF